MDLATILKSHKPVSPVFVPVEGSATSVIKKTRQDVDAADTDDDLFEDLCEDVQSDDESHGKPRSKKKKHKEKVKNETATKRRTGEQTIPDSEKEKRTIFVGNLPPTCTKKQLVKMFFRFGKIDSVRFRCARGSKMLPKRAIAKQGWTNAEQTNEMVAYVVFEQEDDVMKSLEANGALLDDRHIRVDSVKGASQPKHSHSIFVGNLPFTITTERLREVFQHCGEIEGTRVVRDKKTGCGKGFGFVLFKEKSGVMFALRQAKTIELDGRKLRVFKSSENPRKQTIKSRKGLGNKQGKSVVKQKKGKIHKKQNKKGGKLHRKR